MEVGSVLFFEELGKLGIACSESLLCVLLLNEFSLSEFLAVPHLARLSALLLLDVVEVGVAEDGADAEHEEEVALALVVEHVGLVPGGEHSLVLVSVGRLVAGVHGAVDAIDRGDERACVSLTSRTGPSSGGC